MSSDCGGCARTTLCPWSKRSTAGVCTQYAAGVSGQRRWGDSSVSVRRRQIILRLKQQQKQLEQQQQRLKQQQQRLEQQLRGSAYLFASLEFMEPPTRPNESYPGSYVGKGGSKFSCSRTRGTPSSVIGTAHRLAQGV